MASSRDLFIMIKGICFPTVIINCYSVLCRFILFSKYCLNMIVLRNCLFRIFLSSSLDRYNVFSSNAVERFVCCKLKHRFKMHKVLFKFHLKVLGLSSTNCSAMINASLMVSAGKLSEN